MSFIVLSGPTASGKSHFADLLYNFMPAKIVNADSMQIYDALHLLTAQPQDLDQQPEKYSLYSALSYKEKCTVAKWVGLAAGEIKMANQAGKTAIIVGGTGLYIQALLDGIVVIPDIDNLLRQDIYTLFDKIGKEEFYRLLIKKDPGIVTRINANDKSRMIRAMEVLEQTGQSILRFKDNRQKICHDDFLHISLFPERESLYKWCNERFDLMIENGAILEVQEFMSKWSVPHKKYSVESALGYEEIQNYIAGDIKLDEAKIKAKQKTRNYAKRQLTWFRNQMKSKHCLYYEQVRDIETSILDLVRSSFS